MTLATERFPQVEDVELERFGEPFTLGLRCHACGGSLHRNEANFPVHDDPASGCRRVVVYITEVCR